MSNRLNRWRVVLLVVVLLLTAGCAVQLPTPQSVQEPSRDPFHARSTSENDIGFEWSGDTGGYEPGESATVELTFRNGGDDLWQGGYCIQLLSSDALIAGLVQERFTLHPGAFTSTSRAIHLPEDLSPGAYALALVVAEPQGNAVNTVTIHVGHTSEVFRSQPSATNAALAGCPVVQEPEGEAGRLVELAKADLAERLGITAGAIAVQSVESVRFPNASLGVPEEGEMYAQVVTPGYIITLIAEGETYRYHGTDQRVVFVPDERLPIPLVPEEAPPPQKAIEIPDEEAAVTLPLHLLAHVGQPDQRLAVSLRWQNGTELQGTFTTLEGPQGRGLLIDSLDWETESRPPQPESQPATLTIRDGSGKILAQQPQLVLSPDDPNTRLIDLYWVLGESLQAEQRRVLKTGSIEARAVRELLWGPPPRNLAGFRTAIPTPQEVLSYPGRGPDWGARMKLLGLTIEDGVATANFSEEMQAYGGGSARVQNIRGQITRTLKQFPSVNEVQIAVAGQTEGVLQP